MVVMAVAVIVIVANVDKILQNVATRVHVKTTYDKNIWTCCPSVKTPFVPTPSGSRRLSEVVCRKGDGTVDVFAGELRRSQGRGSILTYLSYLVFVYGQFS